MNIPQYSDIRVGLQDNQEKRWVEIYLKTHKIYFKAKEGKSMTGYYTDGTL